MFSRVLPLLALILNAAVWGLSWWPLRVLQGFGLHPLLASVATYAVGVVVVLLLRPAVWREYKRDSGLWVLSLAAGCTMVGFNWGVTIADVIRVVLLFYLMPVWAIVFARWILKEKVTGEAVCFVLLACLGASLVLSPDGRLGVPWPSSLGEFLGLMGGLAFALNNVMLRRQAHVSSGGLVFSMFVGGVFLPLCVALFCWGFQLEAVFFWPSHVDVQAFWVLLGFGGALLCANYALQFGAARLPANVTAVVMLFEVVVATLSALAWNDEVLTLQVACGGLLIVGAAVWRSARG